MFSRFLTWFGSARALRETALLGERDLDDLGVTRSEFRTLATTPPEVTVRMQAMAGRHGLQARDFAGHGHDVAAMTESCRSCASVGACRAFLADASEDAARAVFCPNHTTYDALRAAVA
jgi:hypothetical protein